MMLYRCHLATSLPHRPLVTVAMITYTLLLLGLLRNAGAATSPPPCRIVPSSPSFQGGVPCTTGHYVCPPDPSVPMREELVLHFPGTGGSPDNPAPQSFYSSAQALGFHVASICYDNGFPMIGTVCGGADAAPTCYSDQRRRRLYSPDHGGIPRAVALMQELQKNSGNEGWSKFLHPTQPASLDWSKIVASGHSQGAGMAAYLAKNNTLLGVTMLAGVADLTNAKVPAPWISLPSSTPSNRMFGLGNTRDFACSHWKTDWPAIPLSGWFASTDQNMVPSNANSHMLCSTVEVPGCRNGLDYHSAVLTSDLYV